MGSDGRGAEELVLWVVGDGTVSQSDLVRHESWRDNVHHGATEMN